MGGEWTNETEKTGLAPGSYEVQARDTRGPCFSSLYVISVGVATELVFDYSLSHPLCNGNNGSISILANGGTGSYLYSVVVSLFYYYC